jgi:predicted dehydrogenase
MHPGADIGLAIVGAGRLTAHLDLLRQLPGVRLLSVAAGDGEQGRSSVDAGRRLLGAGETHAVLVCGPVREREFWVTEAVAAGKHVFCDTPPMTSVSRLLRVTERCEQARMALAVAADGLYGGFDERVRRACDEAEAGPLLFADLELAVAQARLRGTRDGVLARYGAPFLGLLVECLGPIDSIYARARSLGLNRPEEDLVVAQLRFRNGIEGLVRMNGLGDTDQVVLHLYGEGGQARASAPIEEVCVPGLRRQFEDFLDAVREGRQPRHDGRSAAAGFRWCGWIEQAARLDREVKCGEVVVE